MPLRLNASVVQEAVLGSVAAVIGEKAERRICDQVFTLLAEEPFE